MNEKIVCIRLMTTIFTFAGCSRLQGSEALGEGDLEICVVDASGAPARDVSVWLLQDYESTKQLTSQAGRVVLRGEAGPATVIAMIADSGATLETEIFGERRRSPECLRLEPLTCIGGLLNLPDGSAPPPIEVVVEGTPLWSWSRASGDFEVMVPAGTTYHLTLRAVNMNDTLAETSAPAGVALGCRSNGSTYTVTWASEAEERIWVLLPPLPTAVGDSAVALDGTTFYVAGGKDCIGGQEECVQFNNSHTDVLQIFNFRDGSWRVGAPMPEPRSGVRGAISQGQLLVIGGVRTSGRVADCTESMLLPRGEACDVFPRVCQPCYRNITFTYDPEQNRWSEEAPLPEAIGWGSTAQRRDDVYYIAGVGNTFAGYSALVQHFDPIGGRWSPLAGSLLIETYLAQACIVGDRLFVFGGTSWVQSNNESQRAEACGFVHQGFDFSSGGWNHRLAPAPTLQRESAATCVANGRFIYSLPGGPRRCEVMRYDTVTDSWNEEIAPIPQIIENETIAGPAVATPHGLISAGSGRIHELHNTQVIGVVSRRFLESAKRYGATPIDPSIAASCADDPPTRSSSTAEELIRECVPFSGCLETCETDDDCFAGHSCFGSGDGSRLCGPDDCSKCSSRCRPADVIQVEAFGRPINICVSAICVP